MTAPENNGLMLALLAVQSEAPAIQKTKINPAFRSKYVSLDALMEQIMPVLNTHGLVWTTLPGRDEHGDPALTYRLIHAQTGEVLEGTMPLMLAKSDPQGQGSAITYARRYSLMAVLGLVADEDDDGNGASRRPDQRKATNGNGSTARVTADDIEAIQAAAKGLTVAQIRLAFAATGIEAPDPLTLKAVPRAKAGALTKALATMERSA